MMRDKHAVAVAVVIVVVEIVVDVVVVAAAVDLRRISGGQWRPHWAGDAGWSCCCGVERGL